MESLKDSFNTLWPADKHGDDERERMIADASCTRLSWALVTIRCDDQLLPSLKFAAVDRCLDPLITAFDDGVPPICNQEEAIYAFFCWHNIGA